MQGIVFSVRPPKKSWKNISNLSGGEKTLSSLSLVFALHHYKPTPLYVMDEIDAALGESIKYWRLHAALPFLPCFLLKIRMGKPTKVCGLVLVNEVNAKQAVIVSTTRK